jgi:hypothetical protein
MVSIIFITAIFYNKATTYFVKKCSIFNFILGYIVLILGSNILFIRKANYSNISLLMNILIILFSFIVLFNILKTTTQNKIKRKIYFLLLGILIGLLLFTTLVGYIYMILFYTLIIKFKNNTNDKNKPNIKIDLILMSVPILIFIIITIFYNMHYTDLNSTNIENLSITNITKGVIEAIVITPNIDTFKFPFSKMDTVNNNFFKSEYSYEDNLLGIISFPVIWLLLLKKFLTYYEDKKNTYKFINIVILFSFIILICNLAIYEISEIYTLEFKFLLLFCAILFVLKNIENKNIFSGNTVTDKAFLILSIINILVIFPISNSTDLQYLYYTNIDFVNTLKNTFMFWI